MSTLPKQIADKFLTELAQSDDVSTEQIANLKKLIEKGTKLKAADIEAVFNSPEGNAL